MGMTNKAQDQQIVESGAGASPSSMLLRARLDHDLSMARETGGPLAIFAIRIDEYQELSNDFGSEALHATMAELASRLKENLRPSDALVRSAEDCFTIIHFFDGDPLVLHGKAKTLLKLVQQPISIGRDERHPVASVGVAYYPEDGNSAELLLKRAQEALSRTDRWGGNGFCLHSRSAARNIAKELSKHEDLRQALDADDLSMRFEPILDLSRNSMTAVNGEMQWQHPTLGCLSSGDIISIAERGKLQSPLNEWTVNRICNQLTEWRSAGVDRSISINVSRSQVSDSRLARLLSERLSAPGITADLLDLRLDQSMLLAANDHRLRTGLQHLADLGISLTMSNVGRGPLPLESLQHLPFQSVCLAPEMIAAIGRCSSTETMLEAIIGFMQSLGLCVRAVDVRFQEQADFLKCHGCDEGTGPFFAPALTSFDIDRLTSCSPYAGRRECILLMPRSVSMH